MNDHEELLAALDAANARIAELEAREWRGVVETKPEPDDWRDDPSTDERWNAGVDTVMMSLCDYLGVDPKSVTWDAATETVDGDISAVIGNILRAGFGEDFDPSAVIKGDSRP